MVERTDRGFPRSAGHNGTVRRIEAYGAFVEINAGDRRA